MPAVHRPEQTRQRFITTFGQAPVTYADALSAGFSPRSLRTAVTRGLLLSPRRGILAAYAPDEPDTTEHLIQVRASLGTVGVGALASFDSAALLLGLFRPAAAVPNVVQLVSPSGAGFTTTGLVVRASPVPERDRAVVDGRACTGIARTAVDLARGRPLWSALVPLDSAARLLIAHATGTTSNALRHAVQAPEQRAYARAELERALLAEFGWAGTVAVRDALAHVDPASESATESRSRGWFIEAGLGPLHPGTPIRCGSSTYWVDFCSPERRVVGEADGWSKYGATTREMREAMEKERRRQRDLEADGWTVIRWTSTEARGAVVHRMSEALFRTH
jgi:hypothetical protein